MGFSTQRQTGAVYVSAGHGFLNIRTTKGDSYAGVVAQPRELGGNGPTRGTTIYELNFPSYEGHVKNVRFSRDTSGKGYGDQLYFEVEDETLPETDRFRKVTIQVPLDSRYVTKFVQVYGNLDLDLPISFEPWQMPKTEKPDEYVNGWGFKQDGQKVGDAIRKEDMPQIRTYVERGKTKVDNKELLDFVEKFLDDAMYANHWDKYHPDYQKIEDRKAEDRERNRERDRESHREPERTREPERRPPSAREERTGEPSRERATPPPRERERERERERTPAPTRERQPFRPTAEEEAAAEERGTGRKAQSSRFIDPDDEEPPY